MTGNLNKNFQLVLIKVPNLVLREPIECIKETLMEKHNALLEGGIFPDRLKTAKVTSLYKKGIRKYPQLSSSSFLNVRKVTEYQINFLHKTKLTESQVIPHREYHLKQQLMISLKVFKRPEKDT